MRESIANLSSKAAKWVGRRRTGSAIAVVVVLLSALVCVGRQASSSHSFSWFHSHAGGVGHPSVATGLLARPLSLKRRHNGNRVDVAGAPTKPPNWDNVCSTNRTLLLLHGSSSLVHIRVHGEKEILYYCQDLCVVWEHSNSVKFAKLADIIESGAGVRRAHDRQLTMYFTMESPRHSALASTHVMSQFNLKRSYHLDSDVFAAYIPIGEKHLREVVAPPPVAFKDKVREAVATIVSNCGAPSNRLSLIKQMMKGIDVHSFGSCLHNKNLPPKQAVKGSSLKIVSRYKFYLAVENSLCRDYVTEKLWRALYHGVIPVVTSYNNTPNYTRFTPSSSAYINVEHHESVPAVVEYLKKVAHDQSLYRFHLRHRFTDDSSAISDEYRQTWGVLADRRRFCKLAHRMLVQPGIEVLRNRRISADTSCAPSGHFRGPNK